MTTKEYNHIVELFSDNIYRFLLKNTRNVTKSKDLVQDAYEKLWINKKKVNYKKAKSYLFSVAYHKMIDEIRKEKKFIDFENVNANNYIYDNQYSDLKEILNIALDKLPEKQKAIILLRDYESYSYKEISELTNLNVGQVKINIYRARVFLKNFIGKMEVLI